MWFNSSYSTNYKRLWGQELSASISKAMRDCNFVYRRVVVVRAWDITHGSSAYPFIFWKQITVFELNFPM